MWHTRASTSEPVWSGHRLLFLSGIMNTVLQTRRNQGGKLEEVWRRKAEDNFKWVS